jgi:ketosteroid isomerase-like protein
MNNEIFARSSCAILQSFTLRACLWIGLWLAAIGATNTCAHAAGNHEKQEAAVRQAGKDYAAAAARGDVKALIEFWTADGVYTDPTGNTIKIRDLLTQGYANTALGNVWSNPADSTVRFVTDDVAVEQGKVASPAMNGAPTSRYMAIWVLDGGRWKLNGVHVTQSGDFFLANQFASLQAFAGDWSGEIDKINLRILARWDANRKYMSRQITMGSGKSALTGLQEIGWDPRLQQIKSWTFSDDGSLCEGLWSMEGNVWMVLSTRILPDGRTAEATHIYKFRDKDTIVWKSIDGSVDGEPVDDFEVVLKRSSGK